MASVHILLLLQAQRRSNTWQSTSVSYHPLQQLKIPSNDERAQSETKLEMPPAPSPFPDCTEAWSDNFFLPDIPPPLSADELRAGLATLPQELYDIIYEKSFKFNHKEALPIPIYYNTAGRIVTTWKPPMQLQIDHKMREEYLRTYYGGKAIWLADLEGEECDLVKSFNSCLWKFGGGWT
ncbi:uncharacterized protein RCC_08777 [Ramularia collo-cygni]|uniref:Uncharacterized protein n=1 Tax=Ramularia collo-cygni TaxID=112498 RepID=A0A2D3UYC0_9PEZI|nr:uncharacterized protein RCC_08777 [Ramularia collo-cygni]CZT23067.1 uncharacterized protein RCC_08777 [Ramularia collo-cygni]